MGVTADTLRLSGPHQDAGLEDTRAPASEWGMSHKMGSRGGHELVNVMNLPEGAGESTGPTYGQKP